MAITTLDGAIAGMKAPRHIAKALTGTLVAGRPVTLWGLAGRPGAGAYNGTLNGVTLSSPQNGQLPFTNPVSGNTYLAKLAAAATQPGLLVLADRLWHNGGFTITSTAAQNITSPTWPARDAAGSTDGDGVLLAVEVSALVGAAAPTITISYTNQAGTAGRSATNIIATNNSAIAGTMYEIGLQAGDTGVRSVQSLTLSASQISGTINLVAYRILATVELPIAGIPQAVDVLTAGMPRLFDSSVPYLYFVPSTTTTSSIVGNVIFTQG